eukprot:TRINITY_DN22358_c0_g1_i3.p1 TRINITY_DN22358_c0_g1~~TRINITY_DN22358_c0_g1_i3.p1  ORF type:complete len:314 (-),score=26.64 TRINITY_DN22358_c0_g1_i3:218-1102(-)
MHRLTVLAICLAATRALSELQRFDAALEVDDECAEQGRCALNALQLQSTTASETTDTLDDDFHRCAGKSDSNECLCVFDIDRTLTAKQSASDCPGTQQIPKIEDDAYGGGSLRLSAFSVDEISNTFCGSCRLGIASNGDADHKFSPMRHELLQRVIRSVKQDAIGIKLHAGPLKFKWNHTKILGAAPPVIQFSDESPQHGSPYLVHVQDTKKHLAVKSIIGWFADHVGVCIPFGNVHFFDDRADNVLPFQGTGMHAHQISCKSRDKSIGNGKVGRCGATSSEIVNTPGVHLCDR